VWSAPGRVNLIGEHTDYNRGRCLPIALPHATYAAMSARNDGGVHAVSDRAEIRFDAPADRLGPGDVSGWGAYVAGVVWAARSAGLDVPGVDVALTSTVPVGAGLSSSAAIECSVAVGLCDLAGLTTDDQLRLQLVECCGRAEREVAGAPTGAMDQTISLLGRPGTALLLDFATNETTAVPWAPERDGVELLVIDTGAAHELADGGYASRRIECERASELLGVPSLRDVGIDDVATIGDLVIRTRARHVVTEMVRVDDALAAIRAHDWAWLGALFDASHASLRDDFEVSCEELDVACTAASEAGALGARMTGGGFGGSAIALVANDRQAAARGAVEQAFAERGWRPPRLLRATASGGARRVVGSGTTAT
jgi:galactokinase